MPHTADVQVEAWAPTRDECLRQAVLGSVEMFLDTSGAQPTGTHTFWVEAGDEQLLVAVLEEIVYQLDTTGTVPVTTTVTSQGTDCEVRFGNVEARAFPQVSAVPKALSLAPAPVYRHRGRLVVPGHVGRVTAIRAVSRQLSGDQGRRALCLPLRSG